VGRGVQPTAPAEGIRWKKILEMGKPPCELPAHMHGGEDDEVFHMEILSAQNSVRHNAAPSEGRSARASERSERAIGDRPLDNSRIMPPPQVKALRLRRQRWERRAESARFLRPLAVEQASGFLRPVRPARCAWTLGQSVGIMHDGGRPAGYAGIERCGSIWACPHCSAVIRAGRAAEIEQAVSAHQSTGGSVVFFTGTLRHHQADDLETTLDAILEGWRKLTAGRPWKRIKEKYQVSGYIRSIEVTYGGNGWHPHAHSLLFLDGDILPEELEELRPVLYELWATCVEKAGGKRPTEKGLDLQKLDDDGKLLAKYLAKVQDEKKRQTWSAGAEMTRSDVKTGRGSSITPFQLLDEHLGYDEQTRARLWREYYLVSKGRRAITWSRGLKERCCIGEVTDADILDAAESTVLVWQTSARAYRQVLRSEPVLLAVALELAEREKWAQLAEIFPRDDVPPDQWE
jgi:hypothetical protein